VAETARCHAPRASADSTPTLAEYMAYSLREVVIPPNYAPLTYATYETLTRLYVLPGLGAKRLDKLTLRDVRSWLTTRAVALRSQTVLTGSGSHRSSYGRFGGGHPHFRPHNVCRPTSLSSGLGVVEASSSAAASRLRNGPTRSPSWAGCRNTLSWLTVYRTRRPVRVRVM
jgi:hypothetical protein